MLVSCGGGSEVSTDNSTPGPQNARQGWVNVQNDTSTWKVCDGSRLVYEYGNNGITTVENAPECGAPSPSPSPSPAGMYP